VKKSLMVVSGFLIAITMVAIYMFGLHHGRTGKGLNITKEAIAAQAKSSASPVKALKEREVYYPGSEDLAPNEMRVTACGHRYAQCPTKAGGSLLARRAWKW